MFGLSREVLMGILAFLAVVLLVVVIFIFRKRSKMKAAESPESDEKRSQPAEPEKKPDSEGPPVSETGPTDTESIKAQVMSTGRKPPKREEDEIPEEPAVIEDSDVQEGLEPEQVGESGLLEPFPVKKPEPKPRPKPEPEEKEEEPPPAEEDKDFMMMGQYAEPVKKRKVVKVRAGGKLEVRSPGGEEIPEEAIEKAPLAGKQAEPPAEEEKEQRKTVMVKTYQINESPDSFKGKTVTMEGSLKLSSKGKNDAWYVMFDETGSAVVRSKEEIKFEKCRLTVRVEKTKLGQIYLDVKDFKKI